VRCAAGFVTREAFSPQTTFSPCRRRGGQAPNPVCALRRLKKPSGERPPLQHGSACEPGYITSRSHQHTAQPFCTRGRQALATLRSMSPARTRALRPSRRGATVFRTAPAGKTPVLPKRQSAIKSLRARATIPSLRSSRSCTLSLRIIPPPSKPGTMLPYHTMVRERCHDSSSCLLPARDPGMSMALHHAALRLTEPIHHVTPQANRTGTLHVQAQPVQRTQALRGPHATTSLCRM
jgi:hypothetical protein